MKENVKSVKQNNNHLTKEELAKTMGLNVPTTTTKTTSKTSSLKQVIHSRLNEIIHETLCKEFPKFYYEIGETIVQHRNQRTNEIIANTIKGYQLVLPKEDCFFGIDKKKQGGFQIGSPQLYMNGFLTQETTYVIKNGETIFFKDIILRDTNK